MTVTVTETKTVTDIHSLVPSRHCRLARAPVRELSCMRERV
jgi:hypothetical protein